MITYKKCGIFSEICITKEKHLNFLIKIEKPITDLLKQLNDSKFAKEVIEQDSGLFMASLDVECLFTNIPLEETRNISCDSLFGNEAKINNFSRNDFENLLRMALQNNFFNFDDKIYKQTGGVAIGSPLGPSLANAFLCFHEQIWLNDCPEDFKPVYYQRYVDNIFALFRSPDHLEKFTNYLNSKYKNIKFTYEKESNDSLPFLDILISRSENGFKKSVYHKSTFSGVYSNFNSFIYDQYKIGLIFTLLFRTFSVVSDFSRFHTEVSHLKDILKKNAFPIKLVDNCIKPLHWLLRKKNCLLPYHILVIYLLL